MIFQGTRVIGDVHGDIAAFAAAVDDARARRLFVVQLGDLVDRGPDSAATLRLGLDLMERGEGICLRGNHDDHLYRALKGNPVRLGEDAARSLAQVKDASDHLDERFLAAYPAMPWWLRLGEAWLCVHGAFHPAMLEVPDPKAVTPRRQADKCRWLALRGEGVMAEGDDLPTRTYSWIDMVPAGLTVLIGHDCLSTDTILERTGALGGRVRFCDTGCGKGGTLSWINLSGVVPN